MTFSTSLYEKSEDRHVAIDMAKAIIAAGRRQDRTGTTDSNEDDRHSGSSSKMDKLAHNVAMRFRELSMKFHGNIGEC